MPDSRPTAQLKPVRLLVNAIHARAGGGVAYLRHLLPLLAGEVDFDIRVIPHPTQRATFAGPGVSIHALAMPSGWLPLLLWEQVILPLHARRIGYDLLFSAANFGPLAIGAQIVVLQNALGVGALERRWSKRLYWLALRLMTRLSLRRARGAIAVSHYVAKTAAPGAARPPSIIHHGVDAAFTPAPTVPAAEPFLLAVGDLYIQKNLRSLVEALARIRLRAPEMTLRVAGDAVDRDYAEELRQRVAALGLTDAVTFLGRCERPQLVDLYRRCAVFVFPSIEESFGMPLVEAMACGAPVVAAARAATPEVVGTAGLLVDPDDPSALAEAVLRIVEDANFRAALRDRSLERARAFSWADCAGRTAALLRAAARSEVKPCAG